MSDEQPVNEKIEVEGQAKRFFKRSEDAEAPSEDEAVADENREPEDAEVEGHPLSRRDIED